MGADVIERNGTGPGPDGSRPALACGVLVAVWIVFGAALAVIAADGLVSPPIAPVVPVIVLAVFLGVGLIASIRWRSVWVIVFGPTLVIPGWVWVGTVATGVSVVLVSAIQPLSVRSVLWTGVVCLGGSYLPVISTRFHSFRRGVSWPYWVVASVVALLVFLVGSVVASLWTVLSAVFVLALLAFAFHVCFLLPLALYQSRRIAPFATSADEGNGDFAWASQPPRVTVLIPAYNEAGSVGDCIEAVLASEYPDLDVVVIDDGSTDGTYAEAAAYRDLGVRVLRRSNGGKHAALNFGLQCTSGSVVVTVDADSYPDPNAIPRMVDQLLADSDLGGLSAPVLAANHGTHVTNLQRIEYAISNTTRRAYSVFGAVPVVPGCLGVYRRSALAGVWGYDPDTVTEDFDLTVKLLRDGWTVRHGTGVVRTVVPESWTELWRQRLRWYRGGLETLRKHRNVFTDPEYGYLHALSLPARFVAHAFGPFASFVILFAVGWWLLVEPLGYLLLLCSLFAFLTVLVTLFTVAVEGEPLRSVVYAPLLFVGYKHFIDLTIAVGTIRAFLTERRW